VHLHKDESLIKAMTSLLVVFLMKVDPGQVFDHFCFLAAVARLTPDGKGLLAIIDGLLQVITLVIELRQVFVHPALPRQQANFAIDMQSLSKICLGLLDLVATGTDRSQRA